MSEGCPYYQNRCQNTCRKKNPLIHFGFCDVYRQFQREAKEQSDFQRARIKGNQLLAHGLTERIVVENRHIEEDWNSVWNRGTAFEEQGGVL